MTPYTISLTIDQVIEALGAFLATFIPPPVEIVRGQVNRVSTPLGPYLILTEMRNAMLSTPIVANDDPNLQAAITGPKAIDVQIDFYGPNSGDQCAMIETVYRTPIATGLFPIGIQPLYCTDGIQAPLTTAEKQYEDRWTLTATMQYNPVVAVPQQSAIALALNILEDLP